MSKQTKQEIYTQLKNQGFPHRACIGIMANISVNTEGTFDYKHRDKKGYLSGGLFQFNEGLKKTYYDFYKYYRVADCNHSQISFMAGTIQGPETFAIGVENAKNIKETLLD